MVWFHFVRSIRQCLVVINREKNISNLSYCTLTLFFGRQNEFGRTPESFSPEIFVFFFAGISLVTATCSKRGCKNHRNHGVILLEQTVSFQLVISPFKTN